jgi:hypothetical protein
MLHYAVLLGILFTDNMAKKNSDRGMNVLLYRNDERLKQDFILRFNRQQTHFMAAETCKNFPSTSLCMLYTSVMVICFRESWTVRITQLFRCEDDFYILIYENYAAVIFNLFSNLYCCTTPKTIIYMWNVIILDFIRFSEMGNFTKQIRRERSVTNINLQYLHSNILFLEKPV